MLAEAADMIASYLAAERGLGRIAASADAGALAPALVGAVSMLYADRGAPPTPADVRAVVVTALVGVTPP